MVTISVICLTSLALSKRFENDHKRMNHTRPTQGQIKDYPPGTIDGSKTPELITDDKAYEVFFNSVATSSSAPESEKASAKIKYRRAMLNDKDTAEAMKSLEGLYAIKLEIIKQEIELRRSKADANEFAELHTKAKNHTASIKNVLMRKLSSEGAAKLHAHVMSLKTKIKIFPPPTP
jgi:hypothetical protein